MAESAFGVEHGEVSKAAFPRARWASTIGQGAKAFGGTLKAVGNKVGNASFSIKGLGRATGAGTSSLGRGFQGAGNAMVKRPGLTGSAVLGGGAAGGAMGMKSVLNNQQKPQQPRI